MNLKVSLIILVPKYGRQSLDNLILECAYALYKETKGIYRFSTSVDQFFKQNAIQDVLLGTT